MPKLFPVLYNQLLKGRRVPDDAPPGELRVFIHFFIFHCIDNRRAKRFNAAIIAKGPPVGETCFFDFKVKSGENAKRREPLF